MYRLIYLYWSRRVAKLVSFFKKMLIMPGKYLSI
jgi:hypothetical protein